MKESVFWLYFHVGTMIKKFKTFVTVGTKRLPYMKVAPLLELLHKMLGGKEGFCRIYNNLVSFELRKLRRNKSKFYIQG